MSQYIVDASIAVQLVIEDVHTAETKALFKGIERGDKLIMPEFGLLECTNVLQKQVRFNDVPPAKAIRHTQDLQELDLVIVPVVGLLARALEIGLEHQLAVYDSAYIALAKQMGHPLITDDSRQAKAAQAEGVSLKAITDFQQITIQCEVVIGTSGNRLINRFNSSAEQIDEAFELECSASTLRGGTASRCSRAFRQ